MKLWQYVLRRLAFTIPVMLGVTLITFSLSNLMGDPVAPYVTEKSTPEQIEELRKLHNLDKSLPVRYFTYINNLLHGEWGYSQTINQPVSDAIVLKFAATLELSLLAFAVAVATALPLGIFSSVKHNRWEDHWIRLFALFGSAVPIFWFALILKYFLAFQWGDATQLPLGYRYDAILWDLEDPIEQRTGLLLVDALLAGSWVHFKDALMHMLLPATTLAYASMATTIRLMRGSMLDVLEQDYVRTARAKGLPEHKVVVNHAARNAMIPTVTLLGLAFGGLLNGSVLTETVWQWPGLGLWAVTAMRNLDTAAILGYTLFAGMLYVLANLVVDVAYAWLDPRVELSGDVGLAEWVIAGMAILLLAVTWLSVDLGLGLAQLLLYALLLGALVGLVWQLPLRASFSVCGILAFVDALLAESVLVEYIAYLMALAAFGLVALWPGHLPQQDHRDFLAQLREYLWVPALAAGTVLAVVGIFRGYATEMVLLFVLFVLVQLALNWRDFVAEIPPRRAELRRMAHQFRRNPLALLGLFIALTILLVALMAPFLAPLEPGQRDADRMVEHFEFNHDLQPPCYWSCTGERGEADGYILGSTSKGYDIWYGIIWGSRTSLDVALKVVISGTFIAVVLGVISGYYGGRVDEIMMRVTDVFLAIPGLILALAIVAVTNNPSIEYLMYALIIVWWPGFTRIVRAQALSVRNLPYVEAARAAGASDFRIIFRHVLPNCLTPVVIAATMDMGSIVLVLAGLGYLGFGGGPDLAEWGKLVGYGQEHLLAGDWWAFFFPGLAIALWALAFYLLGDGLRDILDPRQRE
ncbi:MAG: ABC transporter permease subunit [Candidatus Poseidoniia archaeon]|nr:ABC transporter permease subunit [Candidatus Poseidoniia archaeon]MDP7006817.1 ABC transporter permease subunit [Candidatus Poseidoniia archaeon]